MEGEGEGEGEEKEDDGVEDEEDEGEGERDGDGEGDGEEREEGEKRKGWMRGMKEEKEEWEMEKEAGIGEWACGRRLFGVEKRGKEKMAGWWVVREKWVDGASGGADGGSRVVLGSEEWATAERDDVETGHTQGGVDEGEACLSTTDVISRCMFHLVWASASDDAVCDIFSTNQIYGEECDEYLS
ncbi:uncharacterized protein MONOS_11994 [Monocercomonoides exilis]|uniref:uncharacterized protein n=1 Tax=Monocercomonoides exilis TaxID=2049356 RepID=UPI0035594BD5|nr:hypothetical protein MONOS_11994 [Monocercomonoides exilis]|eukprot:MONOS_11994.1-p1 / transcript=MONOS_11994.1 / gene=MONOS_11994 / organism=Monocercomonoides_exilis_PA203 / gene_product=unspecified product / transcript_product=unspecified product / location=Mono_scaffold00634:2910-3541(+) / protein_length=185 / sequence_SO=supercontig / SO=protein_coding / is_pseudo=false